MSTKHNVIFLDDSNENDVFFCELCRFPLKTIDDFTRNKEYNCCDECFMKFAEARKEDWKEGWRPNKTVLEAYIYLRRSMLSNKTSKEMK
jgi:hypothetical protein